MKRKGDIQVSEIHLLVMVGSILLFINLPVFYALSSSALLPRSELKVNSHLRSFEGSRLTIDRSQSATDTEDSMLTAFQRLQMFIMLKSSQGV